MERAELITHLEHLAEYVKYSEDAPALREVIEMLKDNGDCISRKAAIYIASGYCHPANIAKELEKLPPAQPAPRWIPCSERLPDHPENNDYYLVTIQCEHHDGWDDYVTGFAEWTKHGWDELSCYIGQIKVIAWMPLPEPYKERREDG